ncbi:MAG: EamA family transporter [Bacillus sp. (in: firmicutes)]
MEHNKRMLGFTLVITGACFWGVGGTVAQRLFEQGINVDWLVSVRLLIAGVLLLLVQALVKDKRQIIAIWLRAFTATRLLIFGLAGMLAVQYTYMASINHGNAAVATLLQYLAPVMIIVYTVFRGMAKFTKKDAVTVLLALSGAFLLLTNGSFSGLSVPAPAVIWGLLSGVALAFYTLYAVPLLREFDSLVVVGWAMVIGGFAMSFIHPPWRVDMSNWGTDTFLYLLFVIVFGTMLAFWFYVESLQSLSPKETSLLGSIEPLAAVVTTVLWLNIPFGGFQYVGAGLIICMFVYLALGKKEEPKA